MAGFRRVFRAFPGNAVLAEIESVDIIDLAPPAVILGAGTGTFIVVGEAERGSFTTTEIFGSQDLQGKFGNLGFATSFSQHDGPVARRSGGTELWNGNLHIALRNKTFSRLLIQRVDNSAGDVEFRRLACLTSTAVDTVVGSNMDTISFKGADGVTKTATLAVSAAALIGSGASFPVSITGDTFILTNDDDAAKVVTFTAADSALVDVIAKINAVMGLPIASDNAGQILLNSETIGRNGFIQAEGTAAGTLGFITTLIAEVFTFEFVIPTPTAPSTYTLRIVTEERFTTTFDVTITFTSAPTTASARDAFFDAFSALGIPFVTLTKVAGANPELHVTADVNVFLSGTATVVEDTAGDVVDTQLTAPAPNAAYGSGQVRNAARITLTEASAFIDVVPGLKSDVDSNGVMRVCADSSLGIGGAFTLQGLATPLLVPFGFNAVDIADANDAADVTIAAGTRVSGANTTWVTLQDIETGSGRGPFTVGVRPFDDDDTAVADTSIATIVETTAIPDRFEVSTTGTTTRLSNSQLNNKYDEALKATIDINTPARDANAVYSARSSSAIMSSLKQNALDATGSGLRARKAIVSPPLSTTRDDMKGITGVGVGVLRDERVFYVGVGFKTQIPEIASVGARGGLGFTDTGIVNVHGDGFYSGVRSLLPPEQNAGQRLADTNAGGILVVALEDFYDPEVGGISLTINDYISFKSNGIIVGRFTRESGWFFQSDVTSVDPAIDAQLAPANRRWLADFIIDTIGDIAIKFIKKLGTPSRRRTIIGEINSFLVGLQSPNQPENTRIALFSVVEDSTDIQRQSGIMVINVKVQSQPDLQTIAVNVTVGTTVEIEEAG